MPQFPRPPFPLLEGSGIAVPTSSAPREDEMR